jgi:PKD domain-containing protein/lactonase family protein with 7-bladed beta-propeller
VRRPALVLAAVLLALAALAPTAAATPRFYTGNYFGPPELIGGFALGSEGSVAPLPGSPYPTVADPPSSPAGLSGFAFAPEGRRAVSSYLFYGGVQGHSLSAAGALAPVGAPISSASTVDLAVTPDGRFAFASTREFMATPAEGIRRYAIAGDGALSSLGAGGGSGEYGALAVTPDGHFLFAGKGAAVERFAIGADGSLASLGTTPAPGAEYMAVSSDGHFLFLRTITGGGGVASFAIDAGGGLQQAGSEVTIPGSSTGIFAPAPDGRHLYLPDYNTDKIYLVSIADNGAPSLGAGMPVENPEAVAVSPDGRFLVFYRGGGSKNAIGSAAIGSDGVPSILPFESAWDEGEPERLVFQPQSPPVAKFSVKAAAPGDATRFHGGTSVDAARYDWNFGDGTVLADGGPNPSHAYAKAGVYQATLTVTDAAGCSSRQFYTGQSTVCPGGASPIATASVDTLPVLGAVTTSPKKFAPKVPGAKPGKVKLGTTFRYSVNEAATVRFKIERKRAGRLVGKKCKPLKPGNAKHKKCPLFSKLGSRPQQARPGRNALKWNGKLKGKPLPPGAYRANVVATDAAAGRSAAKTVGFRIVSLPKAR